LELVLAENLGRDEEHIGSHASTLRRGVRGVNGNVTRDQSD
jgi:hypothetical protein